MVYLLHGVAGGWDELVIAVVAFAVLWLAVKLAGRKSASDDDDEHKPADAGEEAPAEPARPPAAPLG